VAATRHADVAPAWQPTGDAARKAREGAGRGRHDGVAGPAIWLAPTIDRRSDDVSRETDCLPWSPPVSTGDGDRPRPHHQLLFLKK
jgi:hypothetical protein